MTDAEGGGRTHEVDAFNPAGPDGEIQKMKSIQDNVISNGGVLQPTEGFGAYNRFADHQHDSPARTQLNYAAVLHDPIVNRITLPRVSGFRAIFRDCSTLDKLNN